MMIRGFGIKFDRFASGDKRFRGFMTNIRGLIFDPVK